MSAFSSGNPFASKGNPFSGGLGSVVLKKKPKKKPFEELTFLSSASSSSSEKAERWSVSATARMREIDSARLHSPEEGEVAEYHIPQSIDRINLTVQKHVMILCGGFCGVRFTSEELSSIAMLSNKLSVTFDELESLFKSLTNSAKKMIIPKEMFDGGVSECEDEDQRLIWAFHELADKVLKILFDMQQLVKKKHCEYKKFRDENPAACANAKFDSPDGDAEESMSSKPRPIWLETLICKYNKECVEESSPSKPPPLGSFAAFLSCCIIRQIQVSKMEEDALFELVLASSNSEANCVGQMRENIENEIFNHTQKYWAQRFFDFLKKLSELKTALLDENSLFNFNTFLN